MKVHQKTSKISIKVETVKKVCKVGTGDGDNCHCKEGRKPENIGNKHPKLCLNQLGHRVERLISNFTWHSK